MAVRTFDTLVEPIWQRQPEESLTAWKRFRNYRDQPHTTKGRLLWLVADHFRASDRSIQELADKQRWEERARAYDAHVRATSHERHAQAISARADQHAATQLATATDLLHYIRTSLHVLTRDGIYADADTIPALADAATQLAAATHTTAERETP